MFRPLVIKIHQHKVWGTKVLSKVYRANLHLNIFDGHLDSLYLDCPGWRRVDKDLMIITMCLWRGTKKFCNSKAKRVWARVMAQAKVRVGNNAEQR